MGKTNKEKKRVEKPTKPTKKSVAPPRSTKKSVPKPSPKSAPKPIVKKPISDEHLTIKPANIKSFIEEGTGRLINLRTAGDISRLIEEATDSILSKVDCNRPFDKELEHIISSDATWKHMFPIVAIE